MKLTKKKAKELSLLMWGELKEKGCSKIEASSFTLVGDYDNHCPLCELYFKDGGEMH